MSEDAVVARKIFYYDSFKPSWENLRDTPTRN
jgi:hypothetical protein